MSRMIGALPGSVGYDEGGVLTDGQGRTVDFTQTLILMTSNLRSDEAVKEFFRPEFTGRLDEVLTFQPLQREQIRAIVDVQVARLTKQLADRDIGLELTDEAMTRLAELGYDPDFGARPLKRVLQRNVQNVLAEAILRDEVKPGQTALVDVHEDLFMVQARDTVPKELLHS